MSENKNDSGVSSMQGENMWDTAREGNADRKKFAAVLPGARKADSDEFADISVSPTFKPINPNAKTARDEYKVAMTGPAAFMSPAPKKSKAGTTQSIADLAASADGEGGDGQDKAAKPSRSKIPILAAVAASVACVAVLGLQSWPSATASTPGDPLSNGFAISEQHPGAATAAIGGFVNPDRGAQQQGGLGSVQATQGIRQPSVPGNAPLQANKIAGFGNPGKPTQIAMAAPSTATHNGSASIIASPIATVPMTETSAKPKAEFVPLQSGISKTADKIAGLSRTDCAARFNTVSHSGSINFESGSATLLRSGQPILHFFANVFDHCREFTIAISGHTDSTGNANYNQALSQKRATSVARYLVEIGVPSESLRVIGYGESKPVASNDTALKRSRNRRIEFSIYDG